MGVLEVHLLGRPRVVRDGEPLPGPPGQKAWALLAHLVLARQPPSRAVLAEQLFGAAGDPQAALRWNLSALRRALPGAGLSGDPVRLVLPPGTWVDVVAVAEGSWTEALAVPGLDGELLQGIDLSGAPAFDIWLLTERRHLSAVAEHVLREAALARLGAGQPVAAAVLAGRLVRLQPLDEGFQALLVRCLAASGDAVGAARQVARCRELFRRELGVDPGPAVQAATYAAPAVEPAASAVSDRAAAGAQLCAGEAAIGAGALEPGLECLRRAVAAARAARRSGAAPGGGPDRPGAGAGGEDLLPRALLALGSALVHAARGSDDEASAALHEAAGLPDRPSAAAASRELGYVELLRGRYERAERWLHRAAALAGDDDRELGAVEAVLGELASDTGHHLEALAHLEAARARSRAAGDARGAAYALSGAGRVHLLRGEPGPAIALLDEAVEVSTAERWTAFTPWPLALRGEAARVAGDLDGARERLEEAFALGCQLGDPCYEGAAARGLGLVAAARGDVAAGVGWLTEARRRCGRLADSYLWVDAWSLEALCGLAVEHALPSARAWSDELATLTARTGMRELLARAYAHRAALGDPGAGPAARLLAAGIDSPALEELLGAQPVAAA